MAAGAKTPARYGGNPVVDAADPLAALRDIRLPEPVSVWPLAPGWIVLTVLLGSGFIALLLLSRRRQDPARKAALRELDRLRAGTAGNRGRDLAAGVSALLRRYAMVRFPTHEVAGLSGRRWLEFLEHHSSSGGFVEGPGQSIVCAPYQPGEPTEPVEIEPLCRLTRDWIDSNRHRGARRA
jgi:hypothetical protein